jgi:hypothetical protein
LSAVPNRAGTLKPLTSPSAESASPTNIGAYLWSTLAARDIGVISPAEAGYGYWGFSPSNNPSGGYREHGVDAIGLNADGYASNNDNTLVDYGFGDCRPAQPSRRPRPTPTGW